LTGFAPQGGGRDPDSLFSANNLLGTPQGKTTPGAQMLAVATGGTEMPGSANFQFRLPIVNLPGRGLDVDLTASYNSRIWNKAVYLHTIMTFDADQGWPAPGFTHTPRALTTGPVAFHPNRFTRSLFRAQVYRP
jgi:hypothetical protein